MADGIFAATLAATAGEPIRVVPPGRSAEFLAGWPVATLERPELTDVWVRLGLTTLGAVAALTEGDVLARFGTEGQAAWRLAGGLDERPPALAPPPDDLTVSVELDPPAETSRRRRSWPAAWPRSCTTGSGRAARPAPAW